MSDRRLPAAPTVVPLDQLLSRRDFCRTACLGGAAVLVGLPACGDDPLVVNTNKQDLANRPPEDLAQASPADMSMQPAPDLSNGAPADLSTPVDMARNPDLMTPVDFASPNACPPGGVFRTNTKAVDFFANTATFFAQPNMFVCRDAGGLFALTAVCTHSGCNVLAGPGVFDCPCHGSQFAFDGALRRGPAGAPLAHFGLCLDGNGNVAITTLASVASNKRYNF